MRAFPAHGSRTALSVLLTPVLPNCTSPSQAVTSLVHLIAETRAPNRRKTASFKLPFVEPQMNTCDNCITRKSAPFQARANLELLCGPLQATIRFFRVLMPAPSTASLASHLRVTCHRGPNNRAQWREVGFSTFPSLPTHMHRRVATARYCAIAP
jgi:hypothetical protein